VGAKVGGCEGGFVSGDGDGAGQGSNEVGRRLLWTLSLQPSSPSLPFTWAGKARRVGKALQTTVEVSQLQQHDDVGRRLLWTLSLRSFPMLLHSQKSNGLRLRRLITLATPAVSYSVLPFTKEMLTRSKHTRQGQKCKDTAIANTTKVVGNN
jgi:hypothetical protein